MAGNEDTFFSLLFAHLISKCDKFSNILSCESISREVPVVPRFFLDSNYFNSQETRTRNIRDFFFESEVFPPTTSRKSVTDSRTSGSAA